MPEKLLTYTPPTKYDNAIWFKYAIGYKNAVLRLIDEIEISNKPISEDIIFPVFFLYRQCLELLLKFFIVEYISLKEGKRRLKDIHGLKRLWDIAKPMTKDISVNKMSMIEIEKVIVELDSYDSDSMSFRFPIGKVGNILLKEKLSVSTTSIKTSINRVFTELDSLTWALVPLKEKK